MAVQLELWAQVNSEILSRGLLFSAFRTSLWSHDTVLIQMTQKLSAMGESTAGFLWEFCHYTMVNRIYTRFGILILIFFILKNPVPENTRNSALSREKFILELPSNIDFVPPQYFHLPLHISYFHEVTCFEVYFTCVSKEQTVMEWLFCAMTSNSTEQSSGCQQEMRVYRLVQMAALKRDG